MRPLRQPLPALPPLLPLHPLILSMLWMRVLIELVQAPAEVVVLVGATATRLPQALAASGSRYAAADQEFWIKGDQASWRQGSAPPLRCGPLPRPGR